VPAQVLLALAAAAAVAFALRATAFGRYVLAAGGNAAAARLAGVPVDAVKVQVFAASGFLATLAALLHAALVNQGSHIDGQGYELNAIAAVVIGGTSLAGGRATIVGTVLGVITFALVFNLLTLMDLAVEIQQVTKGAIILAAVLLQRRSS
jgi:ribose/xylose/arabinose/galactoside ABC-type transport system permease subunit